MSAECHARLKIECTLSPQAQPDAGCVWSHEELIYARVSSYRVDENMKVRKETERKHSASPYRRETYGTSSVRRGKVDTREGDSYSGGCATVGVSSAPNHWSRSGSISGPLRLKRMPVEPPRRRLSASEPGETRHSSHWFQTAQNG